MADKTISALTAATTPLAGTEPLPLVQSGTKKVTVANLTAGRNVEALGFRSGNFVDPTAVTGMTVDTNFLRLYINNVQQAYLSSTGLGFAGNLVQGTAGKGLDFSANTSAAGMTSELLDWYEEGTWTPTQGAGLTVVGAFSSNGTYTRIGRQVTLSGRVAGATSVAAVGGNVICSGFPFAPADVGMGVAANDPLNSSAIVLANSVALYSSANIVASTGITFNITYFV